jgi:hypothetical protein
MGIICKTICKSRKLVRLADEAAIVFANAVCLCPEGKLNGWEEGHAGIEDAAHPCPPCKLKRFHLV